MKAVILAAGRGTRLSPLTDEKPKGLLEVGGETILGREIRLLRECGVADPNIYVVTGYRSAQIEKVWSSTIFNDCWASKENSYSVLTALRTLGEDDYLVLDSDLLFSATLLQEVLDCESPNVLSCMSSADLSESTGIEVDGRGYAMRIGKNVWDTGLVYTSIFRFGRDVWGNFIRALERPQNQETWYTGAMNDLFPEAEFLALSSNAAWCEIDDHEDYRSACKLCEQGDML